MSFVDDCFDVLKFSFSWLSDNSVYGLIAIIAAIAVIDQLIGAGMDIVTESSPLFWIGFIVSLFLSLFVVYYNIKIILCALKAKGFGNIEFGIVPFIKYVVFGIFSAITFVLPWMDLKLLVIGIVAFGLAIGLLIVAVLSNMPVLLVIALVLGFVITILWTAYLTVRLYPSGFLYLAGKGGMVESLRDSYEMTRGKFWKIFGTILCLFIVFFAGMLCVLVLMVIIMLLPILADKSVFHISGKGAKGPLTIAVSLVIAAILRPLITFVASYAAVGIYSLIDSPSKVAPALQKESQPAAQPPQTREPAPQAGSNPIAGVPNEAPAPAASSAPAALAKKAKAVKKKTSKPDVKKKNKK